MRERIKQVMANTFGTSVKEIPADAGIDNFNGWDSLRHLELMLALEMEFEVVISTEAIVELLSLKAIEEFLRKQRAQNS